MDKKEYIANQLKRTFNKKYENYCITRIYHLLKRNDVQIITQQMFKRKDWEENLCQTNLKKNTAY